MRPIAPMITVLGLAIAGVTFMPHAANAWWRGGLGVGAWAPPVVDGPLVYPQPVYAQPVYPRPVYVHRPVVDAARHVAYNAPARRFWVRPHWEGQHYVPGHWSQ